MARPGLPTKNPTTETALRRVLPIIPQWSKFPAPTHAEGWFTPRTRTVEAAAPAARTGVLPECLTRVAWGSARSNHHRRGPSGRCRLARWTFLSRLVVTEYLLAATIAAPLYGPMGDAFGRRRMPLWALGLSIVGSAGCAIAPTLAVLICARALGFGGGGLMTLALAWSIPNLDLATIPSGVRSPTTR
jgi:hypothetical protein